MKDDTPQSSSGTASQKSVTDWLMQVISGKAPVELHLDATPEQTPAETAARRQPEDAAEALAPGATAVAVEEMPPHIEPLPAAHKNGTGAARVEFTAEDLCGTPIVKTIKPQIESEPKVEEITADDVCWVPAERRLKPQSVAPEIFKAPDEVAEYRPYVPELPERMITSADISREMPPYAVERRKNGFADFLHKPEPEIEEAESEKEVTAADISRLPVVMPGESRVTVEDIFRQPETQWQSFGKGESAEGQHAVGVEAHGAVAEPEQIAGLRMPEAEEIYKAVTAEPEPAMEAKAGEIATERIVSEGSAEAASAPEVELPESIFAREGIWAEPRKGKVAAAGEVVSEQAYGERDKGFPTPEDLREMEKIRPEGWNSAVKTLMRLGSVLPWLARAVPLLESGAGLEQNANLVQEVQHEVAGLRIVQYEIRTTIQEHSAQLKRMEEQLGRVRESSGVTYNEELAETVETTAKLVRWIGMGLGGLVVILIVMVAVLMVHGR